MALLIFNAKIENDCKKKVQHSYLTNTIITIGVTFEEEEL